jgi:hypothetical protein
VTHEKNACQSSTESIPRSRQPGILRRGNHDRDAERQGRRRGDCPDEASRDRTRREPKPTQDNAQEALRIGGGATPTAFRQTAFLSSDRSILIPFAPPAWLILNGCVLRMLGIPASIPSRLKTIHLESSFSPWLFRHACCRYIGKSPQAARDKPLTTQPFLGAFPQTFLKEHFYKSQLCSFRNTLSEGHGRQALASPEISGTATSS